VSAVRATLKHNDNDSTKTRLVYNRLSHTHSDRVCEQIAITGAVCGDCVKTKIERM
jgi:hypothetical protein